MCEKFEIIVRVNICIYIIINGWIVIDGIKCCEVME